MSRKDTTGADNFAVFDTRGHRQSDHLTASAAVSMRVPRRTVAISGRDELPSVRDALSRIRSFLDSNGGERNVMMRTPRPSTAAHLSEVDFPAADGRDRLSFSRGTRGCGPSPLAGFSIADITRDGDKPYLPVDLCFRYPDLNWEDTPVLTTVTPLNPACFASAMSFDCARSSSGCVRPRTRRIHPAQLFVAELLDLSGVRVDNSRRSRRDNNAIGRP